MSLKLDLHRLKADLQHHIGDGLTTIVGSGLSCAEGLPGMGELAAYICKAVAPRVELADTTLWNTISAAISSKGLEAALLKHPPTESMEALIRAATVELIGERERSVLTEVFNGKRVLRLTRIFGKMIPPASGIPIVTTNYERLVEVAAEEAGLGVDNLFLGRFAGRLDPKQSNLSFRRAEKLVSGKRLRYKYLDRVQVFKPHGSLDWYLRSGMPVQHGGELPGATRLIITPGQNKFRNGYESPFDIHRERANRAIDQASRFLILGYGFNDDHLETHLTPAIKAGKPALLLTHTLSAKALEIAMGHANVLALDCTTRGGVDGTRVIGQQAEHFLPGQRLWDVESFVSEVLES